IQNYIDTIECALYGNCSVIDYKKYLDLKALASFWIIQEISQNTEAKHPKSVFAYKDTILKFGPAWDFDWQTFSTKRKGLIMGKALWFPKLQDKKDFKEAVRDEWNRAEKKLQSLTKFIDSLANYTKESNARNFMLWGINITNGFVGDEEEDFPTAIQMMKNAYLGRLSELNELWNTP
ncbi:CotH kinase family protein, partial [Candidatus Saccharibacteria bacterium]|nr:CotH kinase family protein [Candidatus Saccharibacteria bacterium]